MYGIAFNYFVDQLNGRKDGYLSLLVAAGVGVTLIGVAIISWQAAVLVLACFTASGIPMIIGEISRNIQMREKALRMQRLIAEADAECIEKIVKQIANHDQG
jgi:ACR3 family arsenite efflux pump ArsB